FSVVSSTSRGVAAELSSSTFTSDLIDNAESDAGELCFAGGAGFFVGPPAKADAANTSTSVAIIGAESLLFITGLSRCRRAALRCRGQRHWRRRLSRPA